MKSRTRRTLLKGLFHGAVVGVGLPTLNCFLDDSGKAFADTKQRLPTRFGTWVWGCGFIPEHWIPTQTGSDFDLHGHLAPVASYKDKLSILSGFDVKLDGVPNKPHITGCLGLRTGVPVPDENVKKPTLDVEIARIIGNDTRFGSIELSTSGINRSYSFRAAGAPNPSETSPLAFYQRVFGEGFQDPNNTNFVPNPTFMAQQSVLSAIKDQRADLVKTVGAEDRHRLDEYFTAIRELEQKLTLQLQPPAPVENFVKPQQPEPYTVDATMSEVIKTHKVMADLLAVALQSNQTRIFNVLLSDTASNLRKPGTTATHHTLTHEEPVDPALGYQPQVAWFAEQSMLAWKDFLDSLSSIKEGDGTLLDNCLVFAHSDCSIAKSHAVEGIPMMLAGSGGGKFKTGLHIAGKGDAASRVGLTLQQGLGVPIDRWGSLSMDTNRPLTELMA
ncbi:DUF1552 domain-containing protein [Halioxenophilus aromaticivorans]|uniref:DUF1552 domain-containing protein n=1 Tax=Halioxenophilus aromaticivorans TaxID=1306992 RepID=A0AAV3UAE2_9ALTE